MFEQLVRFRDWLRGLPIVAIVIVIGGIILVAATPLANVVIVAVPVFLTALIVEATVTSSRRGRTQL